MLLYNQRKEFIGIDEDDLHGLDFKNIAELQNESHDFADLFVKKPGYIHNFKNFSWIDFILHAESDESKAIIHAKGKNYSCALHITPFHFTADESGYAIIIRSLRALKGAADAEATQNLDAAGGIQATPAPSIPTPAPIPAQESFSPELDISLDDIQMNEPDVVPSFSEPENEAQPELPSFESDFNQELSEPDPLDIPESNDLDLELALPEEDNFLSSENEFGAPVENEFGAPSGIDYDAPLDLGEDLMKDDFSAPSHEEPETFEEIEAPSKEEAPMLGDYVSPTSVASEHLSELVASGTYQYDPNVAAGELGLPVDLIEEFIGDFIDQAHEFKDDLYASVNAQDYDNVQILSHKLKGVAANLRVEDAFDVLSVVNTSKDNEEITPNLDQFYKIIAKLEGKEIEETPAPVAAAPITEPVIEEAPLAIEEDTYDLDIKQPDEGPMLIDEEVHSHANDDLYDDLLETPEPQSAPIQEELVQDSFSAPDPLEDDLYDDLLGSPDFSNDPEPVVTESFQEPVIEDDLYDDLLGSPEQESFSEPEAQAQETASVEAPVLNFDAQSSANQLGIPLDIVNEFVQDFKEQVNTHQVDFNNALSAQDVKGINSTATLLKGMSDNLRLNEISEVLKQLQSETNINNTADAIAKVQAYADQL